MADEARTTDLPTAWRTLSPVNTTGADARRLIAAAIRGAQAEVWAEKALLRRALGVELR
jgi:hypothetical protein